MIWWRSLSVLLCILTALVSPRTASGASAVQAETRVKGFCLVATALVGGATARTLEKHPGNAVAYDENASGYALAAEGFEVAEGAAQGASFRSFSSFKKALGPAGEDAQWHHIVEQTPGNLARFGPGPIQNTGNLIRLDVATHQQISGFYSSIQPFTGGATVRSWLSTQSFEIQQQFGQEVLLRFGVSF